MDQTPLARPVSTFSMTGGERLSRAPTVFVDAASDINAAPKDAESSGAANGLDASNAAPGDRVSQAPTVFVDVPSETGIIAAAAAAASSSTDDLQPPNVFANGSLSAVSVANSAQANNLPYRNSLAPTAVGSTQNFGDSEKEAALSDAPREISPVPDLGPQSDEDDGGKKKRKKLFLILGGVAALAIVAVAVAVPVALKSKKSSPSGSSSSSSSSGSTGSGPSDGPTNSGPKSGVTGGDGSIITTEKGTTFTYVNKFGGTWYDDPDDPYNNNAQAQSWTPPLSQEWDYQNDPMRG